MTPPDAPKLTQQESELLVSRRWILRLFPQNISLALLEDANVIPGSPAPSQKTEGAWTVDVELSTLEIGYGIKAMDAETYALAERCVAAVNAAPLPTKTETMEDVFQWASDAIASCFLSEEQFQRAVGDKGNPAFGVFFIAATRLVLTRYGFLKHPAKP